MTKESDQHKRVTETVKRRFRLFLKSNQELLANYYLGAEKRDIVFDLNRDIRKALDNLERLE